MRRAGICFSWYFVVFRQPTMSKTTVGQKYFSRYHPEVSSMIAVICYIILATLFLLLATGIFKPQTWRDLPEGKIKLMRFGCFFFFAVIALNLIARLFQN